MPAIGQGAKEHQESLDRARKQGSRKLGSVWPTAERSGGWTGTANSLTGARVGLDSTGDARSGRLPDVAMVQATDFGNWEDRAEFRRLDWPSARCVLVEREMGSCAVIVGSYAVSVRRRCRSLRTTIWSRHSRRTEPMSRSANGFCQGLQGAV